MKVQPFRSARHIFPPEHAFSPQSSDLSYHLSHHVSGNRLKPDIAGDACAGHGTRRGLTWNNFSPVQEPGVQCPWVVIVGNTNREYSPSVFATESQVLAGQSGEKQKKQG